VIVKEEGTAISWVLNPGEGNNKRNIKIILLNRSFCHWKKKIAKN